MNGCDLVPIREKEFIVNWCRTHQRYEIVCLIAALKKAEFRINEYEKALSTLADQALTDAGITAEKTGWPLNDLKLKIYADAAKAVLLKYAQPALSCGIDAPHNHTYCEKR